MSTVDIWMLRPSNDSPTFWHDQVFDAKGGKPRAHGIWTIQWLCSSTHWRGGKEYSGFALTNTETGIVYQSGDYFKYLGPKSLPKPLKGSTFPKVVWQAFWEVLQAERLAAEKAHRKVTALKRKQFLADLAKMKGTTPELIKAEAKAQREQNKRERQALKSGKKVENLLLFTSKINELQSDLARILVVMNDDPMLFKTPGSMTGFLNKVSDLRWTLRRTLKSNTEPDVKSK